MGGRRSIGLVAALAAALLVALGGLTAAPAQAGGPRRNMPPGWTWPPSAATKAEGRRCLDDLRALGVRHRTVKRRRLIATPVVVPDMQFGAIRLEPTFRKGPFVMDCRLARAIARQADRLAAIGVRALRFSSIHDLRRARLGGKELGSLSRHSLGLAIDVFEIELTSGARLVVEKHYWSAIPALIAAEMSLRASGAFRTVLSPAVDASHHDHLHLEAQVEGPTPEEIARERRAKARAKARAKKARAKKARAKKARAKKARAKKARAKKARAKEARAKETRAKEARETRRRSAAADETTP